MLRTYVHRRPGLSLAVTWSEDRNRRVIGMQLAGAHNVAGATLPPGVPAVGWCRAHPIGQRRTLQLLDTFAGIHLRLAIQRLMIAVLRHQHVGQQTRSCQSALDRTLARRRGPARCVRSQCSLAWDASMPNELSSFLVPTPALPRHLRPAGASAAPHSAASFFFRRSRSLLREADVRAVAAAPVSP